MIYICAALQRSRSRNLPKERRARFGLCQRWATEIKRRVMNSSETNMSIVRRFLGAVASGDMAVIEELQADDCTWWVLGRGDISRQTYTNDVRGMLLVANPRKVEIIGMVADDDRVAAEIRSEFHFGTRVYTNAYHDLFVLRDGQIIHGREYFDTALVAAFFGPLGE
jgi:ketosteroid isomerase-like protein